MGKTGKRMKVVTVHVPVGVLKCVDLLVAKRFFSDRCDVIRTAIMDLVREYFNRFGIEDGE